MSSSRLRIPIFYRVFFIIAGLTLSAAIGCSIVLYQGASESFNAEQRNKLESIAATAALQIDPALHHQIQTRKDESSVTYKKIKSILKAIRRANPRMRYVYTMRKTNNVHEWQFVVDAEENPALVSHVGDEYNIDNAPEMMGGWFDPTSDKEPVKDGWGTWISGYAPVKDRKGNTECIIGMDMSIKELRSEEASLRYTAIKHVFFALILAVALSYFVTKSLLKPLSAFINAAQKVRNGDLDFRVSEAWIDELRHFAEAFNHMLASLKRSTKDFLTGLWNHRHFQEILSKEIDRSERYGHNLCLLLIDLNGFRALNDKFGHPIGDSILWQIGCMLQTAIRELDLAARYGGDEFAILLPETDLASGMQTAGRLLDRIEAQSIYAVPMEKLTSPGFVANEQDKAEISFAIGLASYPDCHNKRDGLVMAADIALCRAKQSGRNSICSYDTLMTSSSECVDPNDLFQILRDPNQAAIRSLAAAVDARDRYTHGHSERVTGYALEIAAAIGLDDETTDDLRVAGLLHDLGKIGIPDSVLNKPFGLTDEERLIIERHPVIGSDILKRAPQLDKIIPPVLSHHERWDGAGYPKGLAGEDIPLMARVLAIADSFDAMTSDRPYRKAMAIDAALMELHYNAGKQFDPKLVEVFVSLMSAEVELKAA